MTTSTAIAHSNLAFVKYWGKVDSTLNLPQNGSISMNLSSVTTTTTVEFNSTLEADEINIKDDEKTATKLRTQKHLDRIRSIAGVKMYARVSSENSFPMGVGIASSASGMAALTLAACSALELDLSLKELSILARQGSGSACRSILSGFVEWLPGNSSEESFAVQIAEPDHWNIVDIAVSVSKTEKTVSSSEGHKFVANSPFWDSRLGTIQKRLEIVRRSIIEKDFRTFGREVESEALSLHAIAFTSSYEKENTWYSGIYYWTPETLELLIAIQEWRKRGLELYFTLDAGPTVHILCENHSMTDVLNAITIIKGERDWNVYINHPAKGAYILTDNASK